MSRPPGFLRRNLNWILAIIVLLILGSLALVPSADAWLKGRHKPVQVHRTISSDGTQEVITSSQVVLPASEVMDPAIIVTFSLRGIQGGKVLASQQVKLEEESDLDNPLVIWSGGEVRISAFDGKDRGRSVVLKP